MARRQVQRQITGSSTSPVAAQISATEILTTSFIVQNPPTNTDFIRLGNVTGQVFYIAPGKELAVRGDNLDNGTSAYVNLADFYILAESATQDFVVLYLEGF